MHRKSSFWLRIISWLQLGPSLLYGIAGILVVTMLWDLLGPIQSIFRSWWEDVFTTVGFKKFFYPGIEIPLTLLLGFALGRFIIFLRNFFLIKVLFTQMKFRGTAVLYKPYGPHGRPEWGIARAARPRRNNLGYSGSYMVQIFQRNITKANWVPSENVWVILKMPGDEFMRAWISEGALAPKEWPETIPWDRWQEP